MSTPTFQQTIGDMRGAAREAHRQLRTAIRGPQADPDVEFFKTLSPEELQDLRAAFSPEQVSDYIRHMKAKGGERADHQG